MTKRLSTGALLVAIAVLLTAIAANAVPKQGREWRGKESPYTKGLPLFFRSQSGTTWVNVGQNCTDADTLNSTQSPNQVWCFEGAGGDSTWPDAGQAGALGAGNWDHWSKFAPPLPPASKWFLTTYRPTAGGGDMNAWCGCDAAMTNPGCTDQAFWVYPGAVGR